MAKTKKTNNPFKLNKSWLQEQLADKGLWHSIVGAFIGGFLAIFAGLAIYSLQILHQHNQEIKVKVEQKRILLEGLKKSLEDNIEIMNSIIQSKDGSTILLNNINLSYFQSTSQMKYQTLDNIQLAKRIDDLTFKMSALEQAIKNIQTIYFNPMSTDNSKFMHTRGRSLFLNIIQNTGRIMLVANEDLTMVNAELDTLNKAEGN
ncbi:MAG TPA: hypothetical protein VK791_08570 [bacterium]|jgi:hypothetical protein|nr:hypothetical protein [bacterium]